MNGALLILMSIAIFFQDVCWIFWSSGLVRLSRSVAGGLVRLSCAVSRRSHSPIMRCLQAVSFTCHAVLQAVSFACHAVLQAVSFACHPLFFPSSRDDDRPLMGERDWHCRGLWGAHTILKRKRYMTGRPSKGFSCLYLEIDAATINSLTSFN